MTRYLIVDIHNYKPKYGEILIALQCFHLLRNYFSDFHQLRLLIIKPSVDSEARWAKRFADDSVMRSCLNDIDSLLCITGVLKDQQCSFPPSSNLFDYVHRHANLFIFGANYSPRFNLYKSYQILLTKLVHTLSPSASLSSNHSAYLVGNILRHNLPTPETTLLPYVSTVFRYNIARPAKNQLLEPLLAISRYLFSNYGIKTLVLTSLEGANYLQSVIKSPLYTHFVLAPNSGNFICQLSYGVNSIFHFQENGGGISVPFLLSSINSYFICQPAGYLGPLFSCNKLFPISPNIQYFADTNSILTKSLDLDKYIKKFFR